MKLSAWIIKRWLSKYHPIATIVEGKQQIEGVRLFANDVGYDERYIYICRAGDISTGLRTEQPNEILLLNCNDVISLRHDDLEDVLNDTMAAFEYYNNWENSLLFAANKKNPEQEVINACSGVLGPILIFDLTFSAFAFSRQYQVGELCRIWDEFILFHNPTLSSLKHFSYGNLYKLMPFKHDCIAIEETSEAVAPYCYNILFSYCDDDGNLLAQVTIAYADPITPYEMHLAQTFQSALNSISKKTANIHTNKYTSGVLTEAYINGTLSEYNANKVMLIQSWPVGSRFIVMSSALKEYDEDRSYKELLSAYSSRMDILLPRSISFISEKSIITCINMNMIQEQLIEIVDELRERLSMAFGFSLEFQNLQDFVIAIRQSQDALKYRGDAVISYFSDCALYVLAHERDREYCRRCVHPVIENIKEHDERNGTEYASTLRTFLQSERSYILTAERMFVHRNTVFYRIGKILEMYQLSLDEPYTREYLLYSYWILDGIRRAASERAE